ncbi:hypothetical protein AKO1_009455 [Acrasis kona]|uniref:Uncharacterized protein n=1 Tax=Acrasis kona TaxID=1008807 RepID=A0AAW2ZNN3_9EUKA
MQTKKRKSIQSDTWNPEDNADDDDSEDDDATDEEFIETEQADQVEVRKNSFPFKKQIKQKTGQFHKLISTHPSLYKHISSFYEFNFERFYHNLSPSMQSKIYKKHLKFLTKLLYGVIVTSTFERIVVLLFPSMSFKCTNGVLNNALGYHYAHDFTLVTNFVLPRNGLVSLDLSHTSNYIVDVGELISKVGKNLTSLNLTSSNISSIQSLADALRLCAGSLLNLNLSSSSVLSSERFMMLFSDNDLLCNNLKYLSLSGQNQLNDACVEFILRKFPNLIQLNLDGVNVSDLSLCLLHEHQCLKKIKLFSCAVDDQPYLNVMNVPVTLQSIHVASYNLSDPVFQSIMSSPSLKFVNFTFLNLSVKCWELLHANHHIESLSLNAIDSFGQEDNSSQDGSDSNSDDDDDEEDKPIAIPEHIQFVFLDFPKLTKLSLAMHAGPLLSCVMKNQKLTQQLIKLDVSNCSGLDERDLLFFLNHSDSCSKLKVDGCRSSITGAVVDAIKAHKSLIHLSASKCNINDNRAVCLFESNLKKLVISQNRICDESVAVLANNSHLTELDITDIKLKDQGLRALFSKGNVIKKLKFTVHGRVSTEILSLIKKKKNLDTLYAQFNEFEGVAGQEGVGKFSHERKFLQACTNLQELGMRNVVMN